MMMESEAMMDSIDYLSSLFVLLIGSVFLIILTLFVLDISQSRDAIRRNYPVIGRLRRILSRLGEFFRQYFFAMDREEMPFNRAERNWVNHASDDADDKAPFGSTQLLTPVGTPIFVNCPFPTMDEDASGAPAMVIGPHARMPYRARSIINISGMSYGAISRPAVLALSRGAAMAGCWLNTGEGGCRLTISTVAAISSSRSVRQSSECVTVRAISTPGSCARSRSGPRSGCSR